MESICEMWSSHSLPFIYPITENQQLEPLLNE